MAGLPDLVRDSKLETEILDDYVVHTYYESDPVSRRRAVLRLEYWRRRQLIGEGSFGSVWMEECTKGQRGVQVRAVKKIAAPARQRAKPIDYNRELEAMAKFSHPNVRLQVLSLILTAATNVFLVREMLRQSIRLVRRT